MIMCMLDVPGKFPPGREFGFDLIDHVRVERPVRSPVKAAEGGAEGGPVGGGGVPVRPPTGVLLSGDDCCQGYNCGAADVPRVGMPFSEAQQVWIDSATIHEATQRKRAREAERRGRGAFFVLHAYDTHHFRAQAVWSAKPTFAFGFQWAGECSAGMRKEGLVRRVGILLMSAICALLDCAFLEK